MRHILKKATGLLALASLSGALLYLRDHEKDTISSDPLLNFETRKSLKKIEEFIVPDAKHHLYHIRQTHIDFNSMLLEAEYPEKGLPKTEKRTIGQIRIDNRDIVEEAQICQSDIYSIVNSLLPVTNTFYTEGLMQETVDRENLFENYRAIIYLARALEHLPIQFADSYLSEINQAETQGNLDRTLMEKGKDNMFFPGANFVLGLEGKIDERQAEEPSIYATKNSELREDCLLLRIAEDGVEKAITNFDGIHNFRNNIQKWNAKYPNHKFSLTVVTPKNYFGP